MSLNFEYVVGCAFHNIIALTFLFMIPKGEIGLHGLGGKNVFEYYSVQLGVTALDHYNIQPIPLLWSK